jgi:hypothetical protein
MPVALTPVLRGKIERRAKRAFRRFDEGDSARQHRISGVTKDSLKYRLSKAGSYVEVVRKDDGSVVVDPPTTGLIELLTNRDIERLQNHVGEVQGYVRVPPQKKMLVVGEILASQYFIESRERAAEKLQPDQRIFKVQANASAIEKDKIESDKVLLNSLEILAELDLVKEFGYTDGLLEIATRNDTRKLKKHLGTVRAYMLVKAGTTYGVLPHAYVQRSEPLKSREQCVAECEAGDHVYVVETDYADLALGASVTDDFTAREFMITAELSEAEMGFTAGLLDCLTKADVLKLQKKKHRGRVRAYKYTTKDAESPIQSPKIKYVPGQIYEIKDADTGPDSGCHKGINVADVAWCKKNGGTGSRMFAFEFDIADIAAIPTATDGKFRLHRCLCVEELDPETFKPLDPAPKKGILDRLFGRVDAQVP